MHTVKNSNVETAFSLVLKILSFLKSFSRVFFWWGDLFADGLYAFDICVQLRTAYRDEHGIMVCRVTILFFYNFTAFFILFLKFQHEAIMRRLGSYRAISLIRSQVAFVVPVCHPQLFTGIMGL